MTRKPSGITKLIDDTLKNPDGKWSRKSLTAFFGFIFALVYEIVLPLVELPTKEYVFITLLTLTGATLGLTVWDKKSKTE